MFHLKFLGPFIATIDDRPFARFGTIRGKALLIYLALENERAHQRETLMNLLWPDMPLKSAQNNLRQTIYLLPKALRDAGQTEPSFLSGRQTVQLNPDFPLAVDVHHFLTAVTTGTPAGRQEAADVYRGPFLADFFLPDSEPFEAWAADRRAEYNRLALDNLAHLAGHFLSEADYSAAESAARHALTLDDLHEPAHRQLIEALAVGGNRQAAVAHYESFVQQLADDLGIEPDEETKSLVRSIRMGVLSLTGTPAAASPREHKPALSQESIRLHSRDSLPALTKPFIGREKELQELDQFFAARSRLVTIIGPGGMGKTQLAIEWARAQVLKTNHQQAHYRDGVHFVDLASLESPDQVAPAIAELFAVPLLGGRRLPEEQIIDYLQGKRLLLILDNFEHLMDTSDFVNDILRAAPGVDFLVTSRERLHLSSEQIYIIEGLTYPPPTDFGQALLFEDLISYPAVQLFLRSIRRLQPDYQLSPADHEAVARICRYTAGMPLAIEIAAAWIDLLPLTTIADEIEQRLDLLETELRDLPPRHRSIRAAIDTTWNYLQPAEQQVFAMLSIFRGDFTWEAVSAVLGEQSSEPSLRRTLLKLRDKSLLNYNARQKRFTIHELLRQYGAEKLQTVNQPLSAIVRETHALYFARLLANLEPGLKGSERNQSLRLIDCDLENMLVAWEWLIENERRPQLAAAIDSIGLFHEVRGHHTTGRTIFRSLSSRWRERLTNRLTEPEEITRDIRFLARALAWQSVFELTEKEAASLLQKSLTLLEDPRVDKELAKTERAFACYRLGHIRSDSQIGRAIAYLDQGLALYQELEDLWGVAYCLIGLATATIWISLETSRRNIIEAVEAFEKTGDERDLSQALSILTVISALQGDNEKMENAHSRNLSLRSSFEQPFLTEWVMIADVSVAEARGQIAQAISYRKNMFSYFQTLGRKNSNNEIYLGSLYLHANQFDRGRELLGQVRRELEAKEIKDDRRLAFCYQALAFLALAEDEFVEAHQFLQKAITIYKKDNILLDLAGALSLTGIALIGQGDLDSAGPLLLDGLQLSLEHRVFISLGETLLGVALKLAYQGKLKRARELYTLVWRIPKFGKSALYDGIAGEKIRSLTSEISDDDLLAIEQRVDESDIWQEAAILLDELLAQGWQTDSER